MNTIARILFKAHSHAEIENAENPDQVVYTEKAVLGILKHLGHNEEPNWVQVDGDIEAIQALPDFAGHEEFKPGDIVVLKPNVEFPNMTIGKLYNIFEKTEQPLGTVWYSVLDDNDEPQVLFADQIEYSPIEV